MNLGRETETGKQKNLSQIGSDLFANIWFKARDNRNRTIELHGI